MKLLTTSLLVLFLTNATLAQHLGFGAKGGLLVGTQKNKRALISYHADVFFESMGKWQGEALKRRIGYVIQAGYHRRGASYNNGLFGSNNNFVVSDLFHNIVVSALLKGSFEVGKFAPYYAAGLRLEITPDSSFSQVVNPRDAQGVTPVNFGLWLGGGIEWEPPNSPLGIFLELNISPDLTPQIFFPKGTQVQYPDYFNPGSTRVEQFQEDYRILNLSIELSLGFKFLLKKQAKPIE